MWPARRRGPPTARASVAVFGSAAAAGVSDYQAFVDALHGALFDWKRPLGRIVVSDRLEPATLEWVRAYARLCHARVVVVRGKWEDFGTAAESMRDAELLRETTHALGFAPQAHPSDARLVRRLFREGVPTVKL